VAAEAVGYAIEFRAGTTVEEVVAETPCGKVSDGFGGAGGGKGAGANAGGRGANRLDGEAKGKAEGDEVLWTAYSWPATHWRMVALTESACWIEVRYISFAKYSSVGIWNPYPSVETMYMRTKYSVAQSASAAAGRRGRGWPVNNTWGGYQ